MADKQVVEPDLKNLLTKTRVGGIEFNRLNHAVLGSMIDDLKGTVNLKIEHVDLDFSALKFERPDLEAALVDTR